MFFPMSWFDDCRYIVVDDVPWDDYMKRKFPVKEDFLTANGDTVVSVYLYSSLVANVIFIMWSGERNHWQKWFHNYSQVSEYLPREPWHGGFNVQTQNGNWKEELLILEKTSHGHPNAYVTSYLFYDAKNSQVPYNCSRRRRILFLNTTWRN